MGTDGKQPSGWRRVRFSDVVLNMKASVDRDTTDHERFIAGEHMSSDDIHLRSYGEICDDYLGPAFHREFMSGQVLYGSRRTYLKKVSVATFDGITANTTFVLQPVENELCKELLPFLMLSNDFTEHSIRESKGSVNPYVNWKDIAKFEFQLPPLETQKCIAKLLLAADNASNLLNPVLRRLEIARSAVVEEILCGIDRQSIPILNLLNGSPESGHSTPPSSEDTGFYVLSLTAVSNRGYRSGNVKPIKESPKARKAILQRGDFLISRSNTTELVGLTGIFDERRDDVCFPDTMMRLPVNRELICPEYLELVLLSRRGRRHMRRVAAGTSGSMKKINRQTLGEFMVPCPSIDEQTQILRRVNPFRNSMRAIEAKQKSLDQVRRDLTEYLLKPWTR